MRVVVLLAAALCGASAFLAPSFTRPHHRMYLADAVVVEAQATKPDPTGFSMAQVRKMVDNLTAQNFKDALQKLEPFFLHEAGTTFYAKSIRRIERNAKILGVEMPEKYAFEASCTTKRRAKQNEFIQAKEAAAAAKAADDEALVEG